MFEVKDEGCAFNVIYRLGADKEVFESSVKSYRMNLVQRIYAELVRRQIPLDYICPIPQTGSEYASYLRQVSGIVVNRVISLRKATRTLGRKTAERREIFERKFAFNSTAIENKRILLIDEAIISGQTIKFVCERLRALKVAAIHVAIVSPPVVLFCPFGHRDTGPLETLRQNYLSGTVLEERDAEKLLEEETGVDSLSMLRRKQFADVLSPRYFCSSCFLK